MRVVDARRREVVGLALKRCRPERGRASASALPATSRREPARSSTARTSAGRTPRSARRCASSSRMPVFVGKRRALRDAWESTRSVAGGARRTSCCSPSAPESAGASSRDGELLLGNRWGAGEVGHHQIRPTDGFICGCGKIGCFEAQASGTGLIRHAFAWSPRFRAARCSTSPATNSARRNPQSRAGRATRTRSRLGRTSSSDLSIGLANVIAFVNPEIDRARAAASRARGLHARRRAAGSGSR